MRCIFFRNFKELFMEYTKPQVIAQNSSTGSYAAGCPANRDSWDCSSCKMCERTE